MPKQTEPPIPPPRPTLACFVTPTSPQQKLSPRTHSPAPKASPTAHPQTAHHPTPPPLPRSHAVPEQSPPPAPPPAHAKRNSTASLRCPRASAPPSAARSPYCSATPS